MDANTADIYGHRFHSNTFLVTGHQQIAKESICDFNLIFVLLYLDQWDPGPMRRTMCAEALYTCFNAGRLNVRMIFSI